MRGNRPAAFTALGAHAAVQIRSIIEEASGLARLRARTQARPAAQLLEEICRASRTAYPDAWLELCSLAEGAGVELADLLLLNLRGDLGIDDHGCSDFGWTDGTHALLGHNEDDDSALNGRCCLLTLMLEDEAAVTTWWVPGILPGNTFSVNEHGLVWGIDSLTVIEPPVAPGRCFVARSVQRVATVDEALGYLRHHPSAGGFAYNYGKIGDARLTTIETGAGHAGACDADQTGRCAFWHTNHARFLPDRLTAASEDSLARAGLMSQTTVPAAPSVDWIVDLLTGTPLPRGVRAPDTAELMTLCTFVADLQSAEVTLLPHDGRPVTLRLDDLARGNPSLARIVQ